MLHWLSNGFRHILRHMMHLSRHFLKAADFASAWPEVPLFHAPYLYVDNCEILVTLGYPSFPLTLIQRGSDAFIGNKQWITTDMSVLVFSRVRMIWVCSISSYRDMVEHTDLASHAHCWSSSFIHQVYEWVRMTILNLIQIIGLRWQRKLMISDEIRWENSEQLSDTNLLIICIMRVFKCHFNSFPNVSF